jgi:hypothetical protein
LELCFEDQVGSQRKYQDLTDLNFVGINVRFVICDDACENMTMKNDPEIKPLALNLSFLVLELLNEMEKLRENSKNFMEEFSKC